eukprot:2121869-Rhodomonas_salina.2
MGGAGELPTCILRASLCPPILLHDDTSGLLPNVKAEREEGAKASDTENAAARARTARDQLCGLILLPEPISGGQKSGEILRTSMS